MSNPHPSSPAAASNEDGVNMKKMVAVGAVSLVIFAVSTVIAAIILQKDEDAYAARGVAAPAPLIGKEEIGIVDQVHFDSDQRLEKWRAERAQTLGSYGWVDRKKGIIHIPIEKAMEEVVRQAAVGGGAR
jgi:hypothetical protein